MDWRIPPIELVHDRAERALVGDASFDPLGHELVHVLDVALEVPVLREGARLHRSQRAHSAVLLEPLALGDHDLAGSLVRPCEHRPEHDDVGAGGDRLRDVARAADPAVGDDRHVVILERARGVVDRGHLRHADARDDPGGAGDARPLPDLDGVRTRIDERQRAVAGRDVPGDDLDFVRAADLPHDLEDAVRMAVRRVHHEHVDLGLDERGGPLERVRPDSDRGADPKPALVVLRRVRVLDPLRDVLDGDQTR